MFGHWRSDIFRAVAILIPALIVGGLWGITSEILFFLLAVYLAGQLYQITRLERWLRAGGLGEYPKTQGIWEEIYYHLYKIKRKEKRRKKRLGKMVDRFRKSTAALPDAAVVLGEHDEIDWFNKAANGVLGLEKGDRGQRIPNLLRHPDFVGYLRSRDYSGAVSIPSPVDDKVFLQIRVIPYGGGLRLLLAQDVTELRRMERMRSDFVANVSHELRTPLTVLKGYLETLQNLGEARTAPFTASLKRMEEQTARMQHLVDDLLLLTRLESPSRRRHRAVDVPALLQKICLECNALCGERPRIELATETSAGLHGDEEELRSAFTNLIVNALKYSPEETPVRVFWREHTLTPALSREAREYDVRLVVEDRGEGIAPEHIPRLTERFYRVDGDRSRKQGGTGLGLAIVKHVLNRHSASLKIESDPGQGSRFSCCFSAHLIVKS